MKITKSKLREIIREELLNEGRDETAIYLNINSNTYRKWEEKNHDKLIKLFGVPGRYQTKRPFWAVRTVLWGGNHIEVWPEKISKIDKIIKFMQKSGLKKNIIGKGKRDGFGQSRGYTNQELMAKYY